MKYNILSMEFLIVYNKTFRKNTTIMYRDAIFSAIKVGDHKIPCQFI